MVRPLPPPPPSPHPSTTPRQAMAWHDPPEYYSDGRFLQISSPYSSPPPASSLPGPTAAASEGERAQTLPRSHGQARGQGRRSAGGLLGGPSRGAARGSSRSWAAGGVEDGVRREASAFPSTDARCAERGLRGAAGAGAPSPASVLAVGGYAIIERQLREVERAARLALLLNRTLILPSLRCGDAPMAFPCFAWYHKLFMCGRLESNRRERSLGPMAPRTAPRSP